MVTFLVLLLTVAITGAIYSDRLLYNIIAAIAMGTYFQQASFIGHDLCHNAVTKIRKVDTLLAMISRYFCFELVFNVLLVQHLE